jgi:pyruvate dehydrogenase E1 component alpha subunit
MDVLDTYNVFKTMADQVRGSTSKALGVAQEVGAGPAFINARTYRFKGHSMSDPQKYRSKEEVAAREQQDPINRLANHIMEKGYASQQQLDAIDEQNKQIALDAVKYASESPDTPVEELFTDIYSMPYPPYPGTSEPIMIKNNNSGQ